MLCGIAASSFSWTLLAVVHLHAVAVPWRAFFHVRAPLPRGVLVTLHHAAVLLGVLASPLASAVLAFLARDLSLAVERRRSELTPKSSLALRGLARNYDAAPADLLPTPWFFAGCVDNLGARDFFSLSKDYGGDVEDDDDEKKPEYTSDDDDEDPADYVDFPARRRSRASDTSVVQDGTLFERQALTTVADEEAGSAGDEAAPPPPPLYDRVASFLWRRQFSRPKNPPRRSSALDDEEDESTSPSALASPNLA